MSQAHPDDIKAIANEIFGLLQTLPSPRDAANALCLANLQLIECQAPTLQQVQEMTAEMATHIIAQWLKHRAAAHN